MMTRGTQQEYIEFLKGETLDESNDVLQGLTHLGTELKVAKLLDIL